MCYLYDQAKIKFWILKTYTEKHGFWKPDGNFQFFNEQI